MYHDTSNIFLNTYKRFYTPLELLKELFRRLNTPPLNGEITVEFEKDLLEIRCNVFYFLEIWILLFYFEEFNQELTFILEKNLLVYKKLKNLSEHTLKITNLIDRKHSRDLYEKDFYFRKFNDREYNLKDIQRFLNADSSEIAKQISLIDSENFHMLNRSALLRKEILLGDYSSSYAFYNLYKQHKHLSNLVSTLILHSTNQKSVIEKFIEISNSLLSLNDFNGSFCIISTLFSKTIQRFSKTWSHVDSKLFEKFKDMKTYLNYNKKWDRLKSVISISQSNSITPHYEILISDLLEIEKEGKDFLEKKVNMKKMEKLHHLIRFRDNFSNDLVDLKDEFLYDFLIHFKTLSSREIDNKSLRENSVDIKETLD